MHIANKLLEISRQADELVELIQALNQQKRLVGAETISDAAFEGVGKRATAIARICEMRSTSAP